MLAAVPIHSVVPTGQPIVWAASRLQITRVSETEITLTRLRLTTPDAIWSLTVNVTGNEPDLRVGRCDAIVVADWYLLLRTNAEHWREGTLHRHKLHHISGDGRLLWSLPWRIADQVGLLGDRFVVVRFLSTLYDPITQPPLVAHLVAPRSGRSILSHAVALPDDLLPLYQQERGSALHARLEHDGRRFIARISLYDAAGALRGRRLDNDGLFVYALPFGQRIAQRPGFVCPDCLTPGSLQITHSIHLPPDSRADEIVLQIVACERCAFEGVAIYEESHRRGSGAALWEHVGYRVAASTVEALRNRLRQCPRPHDAACTCPSHLALSGRDDNGRWQKPDGVEWQKSFSLRLVD